MRVLKIKKLRICIQILKDWSQTYPGMSFLVTGPKDLVVSEESGRCTGEMAVQN